RDFFLWRQCDSKRFGNTTCDLILDVKNVFHLAIQAGGPESVASFNFYQFGIDSQPVSGSPYASLQHMSCLQFLSNCNSRCCFIAISENGRTRKYFQILDLP